MKSRIYHILIILTALLHYGCGSYKQNVNNSADITVAIEPLKELVDIITCNDFNINVIVPSGEGPETYSPTPSQVAKIEKSQLIFLTGLLNFEQELTRGNEHNNNNIHLVSSGIALLEGDEGHDHKDGNSETEHTHHHGTDPHIWLSIRELQRVVSNITDVIMANYPDSTKYAERGAALINQLKVCDSLIGSAIAESNTKAFAIYHPALSYYARDYGLEQIAVEDEGKEPNLARLKSSIERAKSLNINKVLYQREYPVSVVENLAADLGAEPEMIDPLSPDIIKELCQITTLLTGIEVVIPELSIENQSKL